MLPNNTLKNIKKILRKYFLPRKHLVNIFRKQSKHLENILPGNIKKRKRHPPIKLYYLVKLNSL